MTNNPTIDGVSRELLTNLHKIASRKCKSAWSAGVCDELRSLLDAPAVERQEPIKTPAMPYKMLPLEEDGWFQCVNAYEAMYPLYDGFAVARHSKRLIEQQQSTIARLEARIAELESGRGEIAGFRYRANGDWEWMDESPFADGRTHYKLGGEELQPMFTAPPAPVAAPDKYDDVLLPFLALMRAELHANAHKGDRPGWLQMDSKTAILEVFYHMGKLHQAVHRGEEAAIKEYAADVANMCMMLLDVCACLDATAALNGPGK